MPQLDNYEVWVLVDGQRLPEYGVQHSRADPIEITCWIPSEIGKAFEIYYKDSVRAFSSVIRVGVDGNRSSGSILYSRHAEPYASDDLIQKGMTVSKNTYRPFVFSSCQLTDEDGFVSSSADPGQITVHLNEVEVGRRKERTKFCKPFPKPKVHEQAKKGIVHGVQLGPECFYKRGHRRTTTTIQHLAIFKFNYRPLDVLQADGIVPRSTPSNTKATLGRNDEEARIQALKEELRVLEARQHQKKRKRSDSKPSLSKIKRDRSFTLDNNVIDLT